MSDIGFGGLDSTIALFMMPITFACIVGLIGMVTRGWTVIESGVWRGGTRRVRDGERAERHREHPEFRGYRDAVAFIEVPTVSRSYIGYASRVVRLAFIGLVILPWLWPALYLGVFFSCFVWWIEGNISDAPALLPLVGLGAPVCLVYAGVLFRRARIAFAQCDVKEAELWGRVTSIWTGFVFLLLALPPLVFLQFTATEAVSKSFGVGFTAGCLANVAHAVLLWHASSRIPTEGP